MPGTKLLAVKFPWASAVKLAKITRASSARDTKIVAFGAVLPEIVPCFGSIVILLKKALLLVLNLEYQFGQVHYSVDQRLRLIE